MDTIERKFIFTADGAKHTAVYTFNQDGICIGQRSSGDPMSEDLLDLLWYDCMEAPPRLGATKALRLAEFAQGDDLWISWAYNAGTAPARRFEATVTRIA